MGGRNWAIVFFLCLANFAVFWVVSLLLGGDALSGKAEGGRYFLSGHGRLTEVSRETFLYSRYHTLSIFVTHPLAFLAVWRAGRPK